MYLKMNDCISTESLHRVELKVALEILCIETRDRQPITETGLSTNNKPVNTTECLLT